MGPRKRRPHGISRAIATALAALFSAQPSTGQRPSAPVQDDWVGAVSGCAAVVGSRTCELAAGSKRELRVWLPQLSARSPRLRVQLDGRKLSSFRVTESEHGHLLAIAIELTSDSGELSILVEHRSVLQLALRRAAEWSWQTEPAGALRSGTTPLQARLPSARGAERSKLLRALAQTEVAAGRLESALQLFEQGARAAEERQRHSEARGHWLQRAYHQAHAHDFGAARASLANADRVPSASFLDADGQAASSYVRGVLAAQVRDLRGAQAAYEEAQRWVSRGATLMKPQIAVAQAFVAEQQGRLADAIEILERELEGDLAKSSPCFHAIVLTSLGWYLLLRESAHEPLGASAPRAEQRLELAKAIYGSNCRTAPEHEPAMAELYLGYAALGLGQPEKVRMQLARAGPFDHSPRRKLWRQLLEAELLLLEGAPRAAERAFTAVGQVARGVLWWDIEWRAREGAGRSAAEDQRAEDAVAHFQRAEALLSESVGWVPVDSGVLQFLNRRAETSQALIRELLRLGRGSEAFAAARRARRRGLLSLARAQGSAPMPEAWANAMAEYLRIRDGVERGLERMSLCPLSERAVLETELAELQTRAGKAADELIRLSRERQLGAVESELREPGTGEALLLWMESNDGWHGFLQFEQEVVHIHAEQRPSGEAWLEPFGSTLSRAHRLSVLGLGELNRADVHALPFALAHEEGLDVTYSLDLSPRGPHSQKEQSVVIGDTLGDLPESSREATRVAHSWQATGRPVVTLLGADAEPERIRGALRDAKILHYAGHAHFDGPEGWGSYIPLQRARITVSDLLTWGEAPNEVILSACDAALEPGLPHTAGLGIAQAFVLAGARAVVAPSRRISDRVAAEFAESLSRRMSGGEDLRTAYQRVHATLARDSEAQAFRLIVR